LAERPAVGSGETQRLRRSRKIGEQSSEESRGELRLLALGTTPRPLAAHRLLGETAREGKYSARHTG